MGLCPTVVAMSLIFALAVGACSPALRTRDRPPTGGCLLGSVGGVLRSNLDWLLGLEWDGKVHGVIWPYGYSARQDPDGLALLDREGTRLAKEGDRVQMAGTVNSDGLTVPCDPPDLQVLAP